MRQVIAEGSLVSLALSIPSDCRLVYDWYANSDVTASMAGPPIFPETPAGSYEKFAAEQPAHYFDGAITEAGRCFIIQVDDQPVGTIYYNDITERDGASRVELDMWMRAEAFCGKGYGPDALRTMCAFVAERFGVTHFMMQPSARNPRAIRMYEKVGFARLELTLAEAIRAWGHNDYPDSVYMVKTLSIGS